MKNLVIPGHCIKTATAYPAFKKELYSYGSICPSRNFSTGNSNVFSSKEVYILSKWKEDFPLHSSLNYSDITGLSSRSRDISQWFKQASDEFSLYKEAPDWFIEATTEHAGWTKDIQDRYKFVRLVQLEHTKRFNEISLEAKRKMEDAEVKYKAELTQQLKDSPELIVHMYNSSILPFETHVKAYEFETKDEAKEFIQKELVIFKKNAYQDYMNGHKKISDLLNLLFVK